MDFISLLGALLAVLLHPGPADGQRICRRGTERPCYRVSYAQDLRRRLSFEDARAACRAEGGDLLSIETDSEQRLVEQFVLQLRAGDGDFWIGLRRNAPRHRPGEGGGGPVCPSQYYWLDGSRAKFRNWHWDEPSCGGEMCVVLYHQPSAPPDEEGHFLFQWNDDNCNSRNNYICKYQEAKVPVFTEVGRTTLTGPSPWPNPPSTTESDETIKIGLSESSVSLSDNSLYLSYILFASIPVVLLLLAATGVFCYKRRKAETDGYPSAPCAIQGPYAFSDISKLHLPPGGGVGPPEPTRTSRCPPPPGRPVRRLRERAAAMPAERGRLPAAVPGERGRLRGRGLRDQRHLRDVPRPPAAWADRLGGERDLWMTLLLLVAPGWSL